MNIYHYQATFRSKEVPVITAEVDGIVKVENEIVDMDTYRFAKSVIAEGYDNDPEAMHMPGGYDLIIRSFSKL